MVDKKELWKGFLFVLSSKVAIIALGIVQITLIPRVLNPTNMGIYSYWLSVLLIFSAILDFGGPEILSRYLPQLRKSDPNSVKSLFKKNIQLKFFLLLPLLLMGLYLFKDERAYFIMIFSASVFASFSNLIKAGFYGFKDFSRYSLIQASRILTRLIFVIILFCLLGSIGIIYALLAGAILTTLLFYPRIKKLVLPYYGDLSTSFTEYFSYGLYLYSANTLVILNTWLAVILVKKFIPDLEVVGFLGLSIQICLFAITGILASVYESIFPTLIEFHTNNHTQLRKFIELNWKYTNIILMPVVIGFYFLADPTISFFIGMEYRPMTEIIKYLLPSVIFFTWRGVYQQVLLIFKKKKEYLVTHLAGFLSFFTLTIILINNIGVLGAPIAISFGTFRSFLFSYFYANKLLKVKSYIMHAFKPVLASIFAFGVVNMIEIDSFFILLSSVILGVLIYLSVMVLIKGITRDDLKSLKL
jgi:O-antigen/teichoic acid export membrane protein